MFKNFYDFLGMINSNYNINSHASIKAKSVENCNTEALNFIAVDHIDFPVDSNELEAIKVEPDVIDELESEFFGVNDTSVNFQYEKEYYRDIADEALLSDDRNSNNSKLKENSNSDGNNFKSCNDFQENSKFDERFTDSECEEDYIDENEDKIKKSNQNDDENSKSGDEQSKNYETDEKYENLHEKIDSDLNFTINENKSCKNLKNKSRNSQNSKSSNNTPMKDPKNPSESSTRRNNPEGDAKIREFLEIKCYICGEICETFFRLKKHFKSFHPDDVAYLSCCDRKFYLRFPLLDHLQTHDTKVINQCTECKKNYKTKMSLKAHIAKFHANIQQQCICPICGRTIKTSGGLKAHLLTHDEDDTKIFECYVCKKNYKNEGLLRYHIRSQHNKKRPSKVICHICSAIMSAGRLKGHMRDKHSAESEERAQCKICGNWIKKVRMHIHERIHMKGNATCKECGKDLKSYGSLYSHIKLVHSDERNRHKCHLCEKAFYRENKLREHIAVRHTREFIFRCRVPGCGKEFRAEGNIS